MVALLALHTNARAGAEAFYRPISFGWSWLDTAGLRVGFDGLVTEPARYPDPELPLGDSRWPRFLKPLPAPGCSTPCSLPWMPPACAERWKALVPSPCLPRRRRLCRLTPRHGADAGRQSPRITMRSESSTASSTSWVTITGKSIPILLVP